MFVRVDVSEYICLYVFRGECHTIYFLHQLSILKLGVSLDLDTHTVILFGQ
jgi:hypothetical protein